VPGTEIAQPRPAGGAPRAPGLYGKLPARGDFVSRRLDSDFIEGWDAWLQRVMSASREALGARWLECFLSAPVWRFVLPAGMFSKAGWVGLVLPSVDRVGRYFPLTIAAPIHEDSIDGPATLGKLLPWLDSIDAVALQALTPELDLDAFDRRLADLALPGDVPVVLPLSDDTVPLGAPPAAFQVWQLAPQAPDSAFREVLQDASLGRRASSALWMTRGGETLAPCIAVCGGLIPGGNFCAMLDGRWTEHSWTLAPALPSGAPGDTAGIESVTYCPPIPPGVDLIHGQGKQGGEVPPLAAPPSSENESQMTTRLEK
jgi:type VI secretion system protein ImpM